LEGVKGTTRVPAAGASTIWDQIRGDRRTDRRNRSTTTPGDRRQEQHRVDSAATTAETPSAEPVRSSTREFAVVLALGSLREPKILADAPQPVCAAQAE
jgi:hypothetical protein